MDLQVENHNDGIGYSSPGFISCNCSSCNCNCNSNCNCNCTV